MKIPKYMYMYMYMYVPCVGVKADAVLCPHKQNNKQTHTGTYGFVIKDSGGSEVNLFVLLLKQCVGSIEFGLSTDPSSREGILHEERCQKNKRFSKRNRNRSSCAQLRTLGKGTLKASHKTLVSLVPWAFVSCSNQGTS